MKHQEAAFACFGLGAGAASFIRNGFSPGFRVAASAILQPINSYTRYPEYHFMEREIAARISGRSAVRVLDIGSPKLFGFYLARKYPVDLVLTDVHRLNVDPYRKMWAALQPGSRGRVSFGIRDARRLSDADGSYDIAYAMSVLEHIEGRAGDSDAVSEMLRVIKPGGLLVFSVPFGPVYQEQVIRGLAHAVERTGKKRYYFFQRVYDRGRFENRLHKPIRDRLDRERVWTVDRRPSALLRGYHFLRANLPESLMTALGFLNPVMSLALNRDHAGIVEPACADYGVVHRFGDIFADVIFAGRKKTGT